MICRADFEDIFPHLFAPEKEEIAAPPPVHPLAFFAAMPMAPALAAIPVMAVNPHEMMKEIQRAA